MPQNIVKGIDTRMVGVNAFEARCAQCGFLTAVGTMDEVIADLQAHLSERQHRMA